MAAAQDAALQRLLPWALAASGAAGLALEITWLRLFGQALGATYAVAGTVLGVYLGGLGAGAWWFGRGRRRSRAAALRLLFRLELGAATLAVPIPFVLRWLRTAMSWDLAQALQVQIGVVVLLVLPPAVLAGGSLPAAVAAVGAPKDATRLYAANTLGGVVGALTAAVLPGLSGVASVYGGAVLLQVCVAITALVLAGRTRGDPPVPPATVDGGARVGGHTPIPTSALAGTAAASGFVLLGMEVLWVRLLSTKLHNSSLTFGVVLAVVIAALFAGARLAVRLAARGPRVVAAVWLVGWVALVLSAWTFAAFGGGGAGLPRGSVLGYLGRAAGLALAVVGPACVLLGASLPLLWSAPGRSRLPQRVGGLLAINTFASVVGSVTTGALLLPRLGVEGAFRALVAAAALGTLPATRVAGLRAPRASLVAAPCLVAALLMPLPPAQRFGLPLPRGAELVDMVRGANGTLTVHRNSRGTLALRHNAIYGLGSTHNPAKARRMGHLPLLRHGTPERVAFLGMGTAITVSAVRDHPTVRDVQVLELMPEVVALNTHFADANHQVLADPRVRVVQGDGRRALAAEGPPFDVVISDLFIPWHPGSSDLYAVELFHAVRARLAPGGVFALWIPAYQIGKGELESIIAGFGEAFPGAEVALAAEDLRRPVIGLVGHAEGHLPAPVPAERLQAHRAPKQTPVDPWLKAPYFHRLWLGPLPSTRAHPNREGWPVVELLAPLTHIRRHALVGPRFTAFRARHFGQAPPLAGRPVRGAGAPE